MHRPTPSAKGELRTHHATVYSQSFLFSNMSNWSEQLQGIGFERIKQDDGSVSHCYKAGHRRSSFWTQITVKQVGRPNPDSWQVTYARAETQIGIWSIHQAVKNMDVIVHTNSKAMLEEIQIKMGRKPTFLHKISN